MNFRGIAAAVVFLGLVGIVRIGDKATFRHEAEEEEFVKRIISQVKETNKAQQSVFRREER